MRKLILVAGALAFAVIATAPVAAADLVTNGDFSAGNTGFTSTFHYNDQTDPGAYYIATGADHTSGNGQYMIPDAGGSGDPVAKNQYFWSETFSVAQNSNYLFTAFVQLSSSSPTLVALVNGVQIASSAITNGNWTPVTGNWASGSSTTATLSLFNANSSYFYNDFNIDDISFVGPAASVASAAPEPASWTMMIAGFGAIGFGLRRRRPTAARATLA